MHQDQHYQQVMVEIKESLIGEVSRLLSGMISRSSIGESLISVHHHRLLWMVVELKD